MTSIQVQRRRETATFLARYVGAQAELLVDTTGNRVQVHDGSKAGGWPAAKLADFGSDFVMSGAATGALSIAPATSSAAGKVRFATPDEAANGTSGVVLDAAQVLAVIVSVLPSFLVSLPTTQPSTPGILWNNEGVVSVSS